MKKYFLLFATYIFLILNSFAQIEDHFDISQSDLEFETMGNYTIVSFPNCSFLSDTGKPQLPYIELRYLIPYNSKAASISIMDSSFQIISGNYLLYPAQPDYPINEEVTTFVEPDSEIYNMNTPYPDNLIKIADQEYNKGYHIVTLHIYPLSYRPIQRKLVLYSSIIFRINFSDQENPPLHPQNQSEQMYGIVKSNILSQIKNKSDIEILDGGTVNIISTKSGENNNDNINSSFFYNDIIPDYIK